MLLSSLKLPAKSALCVIVGALFFVGVLLPAASGEILYWPGAGFPVEGDIVSMNDQCVVFRIKKSRRVVTLPVSRFTGDEEKYLQQLRAQGNQARAEKQKTIKTLPVTIEMIANSNSKTPFFFHEKGVRRVLGQDIGTTFLLPKSVDLRININAAALPAELPVTIKTVWFGAQHARGNTINDDSQQAAGSCEKNAYVEARKILMRPIKFSCFTDPVRRCENERVCAAGKYVGYAVIITNDITGEVIFETASPATLLEKARAAEMR